MERIERGKLLNEQVEQYVAELEAELTQGHTQGFLDLLAFYSSFRSYSIGNVILILSQRPTARQCAGFRAWEKLGYRVRKGETALWIRGPMFKKLPDPKTGELIETLIGWLALPVFDISQLEGNPEPPDDRHALEGDYTSLYRHAWERIEQSGISIEEKQLINGVRGYSADGAIVIHANQSDSDKCLTLWHELAHQLLKHHDRHEATTKEERELTAEAAAYVVAKSFGQENPFSRDYILAYKGSVQNLHQSLTEIHLAVKRIMDMLWLEQLQVDMPAAA